MKEDTPDWYISHQSHKEWHKNLVLRQEQLDKELDDLYLNSLTSIAVVLLIMLVCMCLSLIVYSLAEPWVNEIIASWEFAP